MTRLQQKKYVKFRFGNVAVRQDSPHIHDVSERLQVGGANPSHEKVLLQKDGHLAERHDEGAETKEAVRRRRERGGDEEEEITLDEGDEGTHNKRVGQK